uniref:Legionella vir region protein n=1 Tax=uncultured bacterium contig00066 TaxID=1181548 RepID=A0A806KN03_9BACT|nr:Legionella vir region protein [uncultured bacterium contig00066]
MRKIVLPLLVFLAVIILAGCPNSTTGKRRGGGGGGGGSVSKVNLTINLSPVTNNRAIPPADVLRDMEYDINLSGSGSTISLTTAKGVSNVKTTVAPGYWTVSIKAYYKGVLYGTGSEGKDVKAGQNNSVIVILYRVESDGGESGGFIPEYAVGDNGPGGGKIFYVSTTGFTVQGYGTAHYLEAAPLDQESLATWWGASVGTTLIEGVTTFSTTSDGNANIIGNGRKDTALIIENLPSGITGTAAQLCAGYDGGGKTDWFLPSYGELKELFNSGVLSGNVIYWTSSQVNNNYSWAMSSDQQLNNFSKTTYYNVRAVRAF